VNGREGSTGDGGTRRALADPGLREKLNDLGNDPMIMSPQEFRAFFRQQTADYASAPQAAGVKPQ
jgi:tripartite-type tricarboxylate transporter receptor subunit TctC